MAQNQTVADVKVKSAKILEGSPGPLGLGIVWGRPAQTNFVPLNKYKVQVKRWPVRQRFGVGSVSGQAVPKGRSRHPPGRQGVQGRRPMGRSGDAQVVHR